MFNLLQKNNKVINNINLITFQLAAVLRLIFLTLITLIGGTGICLFAPLTIFSPFRKVGKNLLKKVSIFWANSVRFLLVHGFNNIDWQINGMRPDPNETYLLIANHQSWIDIFAVLIAIGDGFPVPKFFMKKELLWVPIIGLAGYALGFPIMHRNSKSDNLSGRSGDSGDLKRGRKAIDSLEKVPEIIAIFPEGTRFTKAKHHQKKSPYLHLLKPKAGGSQIVFQSLSDRISGVLDLSINYPNARPNFWELLRGNIPIIKIKIELVDPPKLNDPEIKEKIPSLSRLWINKRWQIKDQWLKKQRSNRRDFGDTDQQHHSEPNL